MTPEEQADKLVREEMQLLGAYVESKLPKGWGFMILTFPFNTAEGRMNYVSNADRPDIVRVMYEFIQATKARWGEHLPEGAALEDTELGRLRQRVAELEQHITNLGSFGQGKKHGNNWR